MKPFHFWLNFNHYQPYYQKYEVLSNYGYQCSWDVFYLLEILKFDSALEILYLNKDKAALSLEDIRERMPFRLSGEEVSMILDKFRTDNLLSKIKVGDTERYFIAYEGVKFYQRGGYLKEKMRKLFKEIFHLSLVLIGVIGTLIGILIGLRELL